MVSFLLFFPVFLAFTLRFMKAYVTLGLSGVYAAYETAHSLCTVTAPKAVCHTRGVLRGCLAVYLQHSMLIP